MENEITLNLQFVCRDIKQAEKFASEAYHTFFTEDEYPRMTKSTILENGIAIFETRNVRASDPTDYETIFEKEAQQSDNPNEA